MNRDERIALLRKANDDPRLQALLRDKCEREPIFWFNTFCWTYDPRSVKGALPFELYPYQVDVIKQLMGAIDGKRDLLLLKSRDMGASWLVLLTYQWYWQFKPSSSFLLGSRKEDYVDKIGDLTTLFEKIRFNLRRMPKWLWPEEFDFQKHASFAKLINPKTSSVITGESANANYSRGGRFKAILFDEFPFWPMDTAAWASARDASPCRMAVGTPYGKGNRFAQMALGRLADKPEVLRIHWSLHPHKDQAWYENEKTRATASEIARELDMSFEMSVEGVVFSEFKRRFHLVEKPYEFSKNYKTVVAFDFGRTCAAIVSQIDKNDVLHVAKEIVLLDNGNTEDLAAAVKAFLAKQNINFERVTYTCDPAGKAKQGVKRDDDVHHQILRDAGIKPLMFDKASKMHNRLSGGVTMLKRMFGIRRNGEEQIQIYEPGCTLLIEALESEYRYKQDANGEIIEKVIHERHPYEDVVDCLRYTVIEMFSVGEKPKRKPVYRDMEFVA